MIHEGDWSDGWTNADGENTFPYKGDEEPIHNVRDYNSNDVNREVA